MAPRLGQSDVTLTIVAEIGDGTDLDQRLRKLGPDLVIVGQVDAARLPAGLVPAPVQAVGLSADLTRLLGPEPDDAAELTPTNLAAALIAAAGRTGPRS